MNTTAKIRTAAAMMALSLVLTTANAEIRPRRVHLPKTHAAAPRRVVKASVSNTPTRHKRLVMAQTRIRKKGYITVRQYAKMTGLPISTAASELQVFAAQRGTLIKAATRNGKRIYIIK